MSNYAILFEIYNIPLRSPSFDFRQPPGSFHLMGPVSVTTSVKSNDDEQQVCRWVEEVQRLQKIANSNYTHTHRNLLKIHQKSHFPSKKTDDIHCSQSCSDYWNSFFPVYMFIFRTVPNAVEFSIHRKKSRSISRPTTFPQPISARTSADGPNVPEGTLPSRSIWFPLKKKEIPFSFGKNKFKIREI